MAARRTASQRAKRHAEIASKYAAWLMTQHTDWTRGDAEAYAAGGPDGLARYRGAAARRRNAVTLDQQVKNMQQRVAEERAAKAANARGVSRLFVNCTTLAGCTLPKGHSGPCRRSRPSLVVPADFDDREPPAHAYENRE